MSSQASESVPSPPATGSRGRGKSRGGLGKYLRARGRGHRGGGRPAEFGKRMLLDGEGPPDDEEDEEEAAERAMKYSRRQLGTNADRYKEEEPELGSDGEPIPEPEVDLSAFLARQRLQDAASPNPSSAPPPSDAELADIDHSLAHIGTSTRAADAAANKKGKAQVVEWDRDLEELRREKEEADAQRDIISRFRTHAAKPPPKPLASRTSKKAHAVEAPPLPIDEAQKSKKPKEEMEDFLDDLLG